MSITDCIGSELMALQNADIILQNELEGKHNSESKKVEVNTFQNGAQSTAQEHFCASCLYI